MAKNRLSLNFKLESNTERASLCESQIQSLSNPTPEELSTMADYILWGIDKSGTRDESYELDSKWSKTSDESIEGMLETNAANEMLMQPLSTTIPTKYPREVFDREAALAQCDPSLRQTFQNLFHEIDLLDWSIEQWELSHGKRTKEVRTALTNSLSLEEQSECLAAIAHWNQRTWLRKRHQLIDLRREQYTLRDSFAAPIQRHSLPAVDSWMDKIGFAVLPLGVPTDCTAASLLFSSNELCPSLFSAHQLEKISTFYWSQKQLSQSEVVIDLRNEEQLGSLLLCKNEITEMAKELRAMHSTDLTIAGLGTALDYYIAAADLTDCQRAILEMKVAGDSNSDIAHVINARFGKSYTVNYISTIFRQKIVTAIAQAVIMHEKIVGNLFFEEEFKKCPCCGRTLLRDPEYFVRKTRSKDGLASRCKKCDKLDRQKKVKINETN